jgi:hypothetical protein
MPNKVEITEPAKNVVEVSTAPVTVEITEQTNTVSVSAVTRAIGNATIASNMDITNTIGDAIRGGTYNAGTTLEAIVRDLIAPFLEPTISNISWSATGTHQADGEVLLVECGEAASVSSVSLTLTNPENFNSGSSLIVRNITDNEDVAAQTNIDPTTLTSPVSIASTYSIDIETSPTNKTMTATGTYLTNNGQGSAVTTSRTTKIAHRHRMYVRAGATTLNNQVFNTWMTGGSGVFNTLSLDPDGSSQEISVSCNAKTALSTNYTWIIIPSAATLGSVYAEVGGASVIDYTDSFTLDDNNGNYWSLTVGTATPTYKVYRSIQTGAFDTDVTLKLTITH